MTHLLSDMTNDHWQMTMLWSIRAAGEFEVSKFFWWEGSAIFKRIYLNNPVSIVSKITVRLCQQALLLVTKINCKLDNKW